MVATKKDSQKCTNVVKRIPKEQFRLPSDGDRKWKAVASKRKQTLIEISTYANGDGTFIGQTGIDYSPSIETLMDSASSPRTLYRVLDGLKELKFLDWTRESHYKRRSYTINLPAAVPEPGNHLPDSDEKHLPNQGQELESPAKSTSEMANHLPNETKTPATACTDIRLLPSLKEPSYQPVTEKDLDWVVGFFVNNFGQVPDKKPVSALFEGRKPEAVKGTIEDWRNRRAKGFEGLSDPFGALVREIGAFYKPNLETSARTEQRMREVLADEQTELAREERKRASKPKPTPEEQAALAGAI